MTTDDRRSEAPWTDAEVEALKAWQNAGSVHKFTGEGGCTLIPTREGWIERDGGPVVQTWAHRFMVDGSALRTLAAAAPPWLTGTVPLTAAEVAYGKDAAERLAARAAEGADDDPQAGGPGMTDDEVRAMMDPAAMDFETHCPAFVAAHPASWPYVAGAVVAFVADVLAREVRARVTVEWKGRPLVYLEGSPAFEALVYAERPNPRPEDLERRAIVDTACAGFATALRLPDQAEVVVDDEVYRFATAERDAAVRCTAALVWVNAPGQPSRLVMVPLEPTDHLAP